MMPTMFPMFIMT